MATIYESLAGNEAELGNEYNDLRINTWAAHAQGLWHRDGDLSQVQKPTREDLEAFETAYNAACASVARGDLKQGEILLKRAKGIYTMSLSLFFFLALEFKLIMQNCVKRRNTCRLRTKRVNCCPSTSSNFTHYSDKASLRAPRKLPRKSLSTSKSWPDLEIRTPLIIL